MKTPYSTASIPDNSLSREAFEATLEGEQINRLNDGYMSPTQDAKWAGWQAALSSRVDVEALRKALSKAHSGLHHIAKSMNALPCNDILVLLSINSVIRFEMQCIEQALALASGEVE